MSSLSTPSRFTVSTALTAALALAVACGGGEEAGSAGEDTGAQRQTVTVEASDFSFSPAAFSVQNGDPFDLFLTNSGNASHTFTIDELGVDAEVAAGEESIVSVTPSDAGEFSFYCRFHRQQGMEGQITVTGAVSGGGRGSGSAPTESPDDDPYYDY